MQQVDASHFGRLLEGFGVGGLLGAIAVLIIAGPLGAEKVLLRLIHVLWGGCSRSGNEPVISPLALFCSSGRSRGDGQQRLR
jgi:hypothetical protein